MFLRKRLILTCIILLIAIICPTSCSQEYTTFNKYGFSFQYPQDYSFKEFGILEEDGTTVGSQIQVRPDKGFGGLQVNWYNTRVDEYSMVYYKLEDSLQADFDYIEQSEPIATVDRGDVLEGEKDGNRMLYSYYTVTPMEGDKARGIGAVFHYSEAARFITMFTTNDASCSDEEILKDFQKYLDSFTFEGTS